MILYTRPRERIKNRARLAKKKKKKKAEIESRTSQTCARACVVPSSALGRSRFLVLARDRSRSLYEATKFFVNCRRRTCKQKRSQKRNKKEKRGSPLFRVLKKLGGDLAPEFQQNRKGTRTRIFEHTFCLVSSLAAKRRGKDHGDEASRRRRRRDHHRGGF